MDLKGFQEAKDAQGKEYSEADELKAKLQIAIEALEHISTDTHTNNPLKIPTRSWTAHAAMEALYRISKD